jgi:hypothetical protein
MQQFWVRSRHPSQSPEGRQEQWLCIINKTSGCEASIPEFKKKKKKKNVRLRSSTQFLANKKNQAGHTKNKPSRVLNEFSTVNTGMEPVKS